MNIPSEVKLSNLWENYNNMLSKTTALHRITEMEEYARETHLERAIKEATSKDHINSKKVDIKPVVEHVELLSWVENTTGKGRNFDLKI